MLRPAAPSIGSLVSNGLFGDRVFCPNGAGFVSAKKGATPVAVVPSEVSLIQCAKEEGLHTLVAFRRGLKPINPGCGSRGTGSQWSGDLRASFNGNSLS